MVGLPWGKTAGQGVWDLDADSPEPTRGFHAAAKEGRSLSDHMRPGIPEEFSFTLLQIR